jgi:hypothetical protein
MRFWTKFWIAAFAAMAFGLMQVYSDGIGRLELSIQGTEFSFGLYLVVACLILLWIIWTSLRTFTSCIASLFIKNKNAEEMKSINGIIRLIVANDSDFKDLYYKTSVHEGFMILKTALALKRNLVVENLVEMTGLRCIDIYILGNELRKCNKNGDITKALSVATKAIKKYHEFIGTIKEDILETAKLAKMHGYTLDFDPRMFRYSLSAQYIRRYLLEMDEIDFRLEQELTNKTRKLERMLKSYAGDARVLELYLNFIETAPTLNYDDKKVLSYMEPVLATNPARWMARYLLQMNRNDMFELVQAKTASVGSSHLGKLWLLLEIATGLSFISKARELVRAILIVDKTNEIYKFYVQHSDIFLSDQELHDILIERKK